MKRNSVPDILNYKIAFCYSIFKFFDLTIRWSLIILLPILTILSFCNNKFNFQLAVIHLYSSLIIIASIYYLRVKLISKLRGVVYINSIYLFGILFLFATKLNTIDLRFYLVVSLANPILSGKSFEEKIVCRASI